MIMLGVSAGLLWLAKMIPHRVFVAILLVQLIVFVTFLTRDIPVRVRLCSIRVSTIEWE
jgi:hypothetical protein